MSQKRNSALVILAAYDYESLQLTLKSVEHTVPQDQLVVVVLNGKRTFTAERVERIARNWASQNPENRFVVKPLSAGSPPYIALTEIFQHFEPLKNIDYICKIDDDLIPLKKDWLQNIANAYHQLEKDKKLNFVTSLINNNSWGFKELVDLFGKQKEYNQIMNYPSIAGHYHEKVVPAGEIDQGIDGTVWQYPYVAWWVHQWTSIDIKNFIAKTKDLGLKRIEDDIHYSIGCIYFNKNYWLSIDHKAYGTRFDELLLHVVGNETKREKWAVMNEPMIHLFYRTQRVVNHDLIDQVQVSLANHFKDDSFKKIERMEAIHYASMADEYLKNIQTNTQYVHRKISSLSIGKDWNIKSKVKKFFSGKMNGDN